MDELKQFEEEIEAIPSTAEDLYQDLKIELPKRVPYIGMGSSYYAAVCLRRAGACIYAELASEVSCLDDAFRPAEAVLISQSGRSAETVEVAERFSCVHAVTNDAQSPLAVHPHTRTVADIAAGAESGPASKTFFNTLVALYAGHGYDLKPALRRVREHWNEFREAGARVARDVATALEQNSERVVVFIAGGPNGGVASQAALLFSEVTKSPSAAYDVAQYDHGFSEAARKTLLVALREEGRLRSRMDAVINRVRDHGGAVSVLDVPPVPEALTPFVTIPALNFAALHLGQHLGIRKIFAVGSKVNES